MKTILSIIFIIITTAAIQAQAIINQVDSVKFDSTASLSDAVKMDYRLGGIYVPTSFKGSAITIYGSDDTTSANFKQLFYDGSAVSITVTKDKWLTIKPVQVYAFPRYIKFKSDSAQTTSGGEYLEYIKTVF